MLYRQYTVVQGWVVAPHPLKNGVSSVARSAYSCPPPATGGGEKEGESVAQQREKGRDWWNVKFSSAEETGLALLPVIGLAPFPKSKPTTLYCHFLFFSASLLLALTHIHQFPIQSTQSPAVPSIAPSRSSMLVELSLFLCILVKQRQATLATFGSCSWTSSWTHKLKKNPFEWINESRPRVLLSIFHQAAVG